MKYMIKDAMPMAKVKVEERRKRPVAGVVGNAIGAGAGLAALNKGVAAVNAAEHGVGIKGSLRVVKDTLKIKNPKIAKAGKVGAIIGAAYLGAKVVGRVFGGKKEKILKQAAFRDEFLTLYK